MKIPIGINDDKIFYLLIAKDINFVSLQRSGHGMSYFQKRARYCIQKLLGDIDG